MGFQIAADVRQPLDGLEQVMEDSRRDDQKETGTCRILQRRRHLFQNKVIPL
jgi:hypothetical protein